jgi:general secretion pathway protein L
LRIADGGTLSQGAVTRLVGSRVELYLQPGKFLFRPLELPSRATEFLDGVVRAQIDRLTPWAARDAAFGWSAPTAFTDDRIRVTVAATAQSRIAPYVQAIADGGAHSIVVYACPQHDDSGAQPIKILEQSGRGKFELRTIRRLLWAIFAGAGIMAATASAAAVVIGNYFDRQREEIVLRAVELRSPIYAGDSGRVSTALRELERRKREHPSAVLVLDALAQILPDGTYVTELRIDGNKLQLSGLSRDAPSLIRLIEQSPHFVRATFFAPTTRSAGDNADQFHVEVTVQPVFASGT